MVHIGTSPAIPGLSCCGPPPGLRLLMANLQPLTIFLMNWRLAHNFSWSQSQLSLSLAPEPDRSDPAPVGVFVVFMASSWTHGTAVLT